MKDIREVYPDQAGRTWFETANYDPLLQSMGYDIALQVDDDDYQGDSRLLFRDGGRWGLLIFGWGSCSGCDALQACDSFEEVDTLRSELHDKVLWKDSREEMLRYMNGKDWETEWHWHSDEGKEFLAKAVELLEDGTVADVKGD